MKITKTIAALRTGALLWLLTMPVSGFAADQPQLIPGSQGGIAFIEAILKRLLGWIYTIFFIIAAIMIIWAAFSYLTAGGDDEKIATAKKQFIYAVVAIVVALIAVSVQFIVAALLGATAPQAP